MTPSRELSAIIDEIYKRSVDAVDRIASYIHLTPIEASATFSKMTNSKVLLKYENLQKTGAFKVRGALYKISKLVGKVKGVVAASAGNHAQGVAYAASIYGLSSIIVMPESASISKIEATRGYGAKVILHGRIYDDAEKKAQEIAKETGYEFIHPFDDPDIIAGQATIAHELIKQVGSFDAVIVPIGGGGLISGIAIVVKRLMPGVRVIGVEPENAPKMLESIKSGKPVTITPKPTIADGLATKKPGELTYKIVSELVDEIVTVSEEELAHTIYLLLERGKVLVEGAGAASLAALIYHKVELQGRRVIAIISGGNIDLNALYRVLLRGLAEGGRLARIIGYLPDYPGQLYQVLETIARYRGNILDIFHDRSDVMAPAWHAKVSIIFEIPSKDHLENIIKELRRRGFSFKVECPK
ncbi:MAG: threonine ammonia-lyase [Pyrodictiaceae archaeon]